MSKSPNGFGGEETGGDYGVFTDGFECAFQEFNFMNCFRCFYIKTSL